MVVTIEKSKILVVDDEEGMRELLSFMLRTEGYHIVEAANGEDAVELLAEQVFDVVISDIMMPGMGGMELLRRIRNRNDDVVVIVMTAYASLQTAIEAMKFGAYDYLIKPFNDVEKVINIVARAVERCRLARRNILLLKDLRAANRRLEEMFAESQERTAQLEATCDELQEREFVKSQLVSSISQQLRAPLALVKGYVTLMIDRFLGGVTEEQSKALEMVDERTNSLINVVDDLLLMQDIESGKAYLCLETVSLIDLAQRVCHRMQSHAQRKSMTLQIKTSDDDGANIPSIQGDSWRLEQALSRLLDSAIQFGLPGTCVSIELGMKEQHLYVGVHQTQDIPPDRLERAFDRPYSLGYQTPQQADGLGLWLAKYIAEMHGGDVTLVNESGNGTTLCLTLPVEDKGRLLHQSMALNSDLAAQFRDSVGVFTAWQATT
ncbi:MAG: hypothetical protein B6I34_01710 [Anaerolineaceae bacterium 4572_32.1]|nr:MAG: hypothetical protein B6I34_01710 [Anaerolineaceae bacterium 4572_32.1]